MKKFEDYVVYKHPTGSRYICSPPPVDTDNDTIFLVDSTSTYQWMSSLQREGFIAHESDQIEYDSQGLFVSLRKGAENYIVTEDEEFYDKFVQATEMAKHLNLTRKKDRIYLFQKMLYG